MAHKYWQHIVKDYYRKQGFYAVIERYFDGKNVDVGLEKDGQKQAVEVDLDGKNLLENVQKDLATCDKVIVRVKSEDAKEGYEKKLRAAFDEEVMKKVSFEVLRTFI